MKFTVDPIGSSKHVGSFRSYKNLLRYHLRPLIFEKYHAQTNKRYVTWNHSAKNYLGVRLRKRHLELALVHCIRMTAYSESTGKFPFAVIKMILSS